MDNEIINELIKKFKTASDFKSAVYLSLSWVCRMYEFPYGECWIPNSSGDQLEIFSIWNNGDSNISEFVKFTQLCKFGKGVGLIGKCWQKGKPQLWENISSSKNFLRDDMARKTGFNGGIAFPSVINEKDVIIFSFFVLRFKKKDSAFVNELWSLIQKINSIIKYNMPDPINYSRI